MIKKVQEMAEMAASSFFLGFMPGVNKTRVIGQLKGAGVFACVSVDNEKRRSVETIRRGATKEEEEATVEIENKKRKDMR